MWVLGLQAAEVWMLPDTPAVWDSQAVWASASQAVWVQTLLGSQAVAEQWALQEAEEIWVVLVTQEVLAHKEG
jgi:hypothetical protein